MKEICGGNGWGCVVVLIVIWLFSCESVVFGFDLFCVNFDVVVVSLGCGCKRRKKC